VPPHVGEGRGFPPGFVVVAVAVVVAVFAVAVVVIRSVSVGLSLFDDSPPPEVFPVFDFVWSGRHIVCFLSKIHAMNDWVMKGCGQCDRK